jgi:hypothetical protein
MTITHQVDEVKFEDNNLILLVDGKSYSFELKKISAKLLAATDWQRKLFTISPSGYGIHWTMLDEDLSIDGLLKNVEG